MPATNGRRCRAAVAPASSIASSTTTAPGRIGVLEFERGDAKHDPVGGRHARDPPVVAPGVDQGVEFRLPPADPVDERVGELHQRSRPEAALVKPRPVPRIDRGVELRLIERLKRDFPRPGCDGS